MNFVLRVGDSQSADLRGFVRLGYGVAFLEFRPGYGSALWPPSSQDFFPMAPQQNQLQISNFRLRILIIGRANAGKTSILERVRDTTRSLKVYWLDQSGQRSEVCPRS